MQKSWYIIYTKPGSEKKVAGSLSKRKIENFIPVSAIHNNKIFLRKKIHTLPLFNSYVFVRIESPDFAKIGVIKGAVGFVYWKGNPAKIHEEEIETIKEFTANYPIIKLEKVLVEPGDHVQNMDTPHYSIEGNLLSIKTTTVKVKLPSIGFTMVAVIDDESRLTKGDITFGRKGMLLQS